MPREWRYLPEWPPATDEHALYLQPNRELGETQPTPTAAPSTFIYDPADPTPAVGGRMINPAIGGYRDNRKLEERDDVLTFTGPPLIEPLEVIGNPVVELVHRTDNPYADLFVRLCEVSKNGRSVNVSDGFQRLEPTKSSGTIQLRLDAMAHRFIPRNPPPPADFRRRASALRRNLPAPRQGSGDEQRASAISADDLPWRRRFLAHLLAVSNRWRLVTLRGRSWLCLD